MPQAIIEVNGVAGSDTDVPINTAVQLSNDDAGDETSYTWAILDQPPGTAVALSSTSIENPTFTPTKEGAYLIELVTDSGLATEQRDTVIVGVLSLKSQLLAPAASERSERGSRGWADTPGMDGYVTLMERLNADPDIIVAQNNDGGALNAGDVVRFVGIATLKSGLPGEEIVPRAVKALATSSLVLDEILGLVVGGVDGTAGAVNGELVRVRLAGYQNQQLVGTPASVNDPVFVSDTGSVSLVAGTNSREIGHVVELSGGNYRIWFGRPASGGGGGGGGSGVIEASTIDAGAIISPTLGVHPTHNWNPSGLSTAYLIRALNGSGVDLSLSGLTAQAPGRVIVLLNVSTSLDITLLHDQTGLSTAANCFLLPGAVGYTLDGGAGVKMFYDGTSSRWRLFDRA